MSVLSDARTSDDGWSPIGPFDAGWAGIEYVDVLRGLLVPSVPDLRRAVALLHADGGVLGRHYDFAAGRVRQVGADELDARLEDMVRPSDSRDPDVGAAAAETGPSLGALPMRCVVGPDWFAVRFSHAFVDGWSAHHVLAQLLRQAVSPDVLPVPWELPSRLRQEAAAAGALLRRPRAVVTAARQRDELRGGAYAPLPPGTPGPSTATLVSRPGFLADLSALRTRDHPGASTAMVLLARFRQGLAAGGRAPEPGTEMLFDIRSMGRATEQGFGNYVAPLTVTPPDPDDPVSTTAHVRAVRDSGVPVVAAVAGRLRARRPAGSGGERQVRVATGRPRVTLSYMNRHSPLALIPWDPDGTPYLGLVSTPNGLGSVSLTAYEIGSRLAISTSWFDAGIPGDLVRAAAAHALDLPPA